MGLLGRVFFCATISGRPAIERTSAACLLTQTGYTYFEPKLRIVPQKSPFWKVTQLRFINNVMLCVAAISSQGASGGEWRALERCSRHNASLLLFPYITYSEFVIICRRLWGIIRKVIGID